MTSSNRKYPSPLSMSIFISNDRSKLPKSSGIATPTVPLCATILNTHCDLQPYANESLALVIKPCASYLQRTLPQPSGLHFSLSICRSIPKVCFMWARHVRKRDFVRLSIRYSAVSLSSSQALHPLLLSAFA